MENFSKKYKVTCEEITSSYNISPNEDVNNLVKQLKILYNPLPICKIFGIKSLNYLIELSSRYAFGTIGNLNKNDHMLLAYSLWLSLIWIVDGIFDKFQNVLTEDDINEVIKSFSKLNNPFLLFDKRVLNTEISLSQLNINKDIDTNYDKNNIVECLINTINTIYRTYLELIRKCNKLQFTNITYYLNEYFESNLINKNMSLQEYEEWRLKSGAMMCVIWHIMMFKNNNSVKRDDELFIKVSLIVSYNNDILSFDRDIKDGTPNLIDIIKKEKEVSIFEAFKEAVIIINNLYKDISLIIDNYDEEIKELVLIIIEESHNWAIKEDRYKVGCMMLEKVLNDDHDNFDEMMNMRDSTPGDPENMVVKNETLDKNNKDDQPPISAERYR